MQNNLSDFIFQSKYAKYLPHLNRKETWSEAIDRILNMHIDHLSENYPDVLNSSDFNNDLLSAINSYKDKIVLGSQRALQFAGSPILNKNCRMFNCSFTYADRLSIFKEIEWILLCGAGAGISVEKQHVSKLPKMIDKLNDEFITHVIEDSIEGWSIAVDAIVRYYFTCTPKPVFDYSLIRPEGSLITGGYLAPGSAGLERCINHLDSLLQKIHNTTKKLSALNVTDMLSHCADSVLSGGVRRSAMIILFSPEDEEMFNCKTGKWFYDNPQRARFNMSAALEREETVREVFDKLFTATKECGEPGFFFRGDEGVGCNPCQPAWATVLTPKGISTIGEIQIGDEIWSETGWTKVVNKWSTGVKEVYEYRVKSGSFIGTKNHKIVSNGEKIEVGKSTHIDALSMNVTTFENSSKILSWNEEITEILHRSTEEVFDITVDNEPHTYWTGGVNVSNCAEIGFKPVLNELTGIEFCNLISINGSLIDSAEKFYTACKHAATIGTIQASYNKFPFLGEVTEQLIKNDPLIGVSIGGIMCNPQILLDKKVLQEGADIIKRQNAKIAKILGINPSSRVTCVKPEISGYLIEILNLNLIELLGNL